MENSIKLISVPYDSAHFNKRMGAGPRFLINSGLLKSLKHCCNEVVHKEILLDEKFPTEIFSTFNLLTRIKSEVYEAHQKAYFPVVISGNCCATVGIVAAINSSDTAVIWFDAHGDCEIPESTASGFLDGMSLSLLLNKCWKNLNSSLQLNTSIKGKNIVLVGARDLSEWEKKFISRNEIPCISVEDIKNSNLNSMEAAWKSISKSGCKKIHFHIDVDVIDPSIANANSYSVPNGLTSDNVIEIIQYFKTKAPATSLAVASYDPTIDEKGTMLPIIEDIIKAILP